MSGSINRRRLLVLGAAAAAGACLGLPQGLLAQPSGPVQAGSLADYPKDGVYDGYAKTGGVLIVRSGGTLYALTSTCTHKRATLRADGLEIRCPSHHSRYGLTGTPTKGPAKKPLTRFAIRLEGDRVVVDPSRTVVPGDPDAGLPLT